MRLVSVHPFADLSEAAENARTAIIIAREEGLSVTVRAHSLSTTNPELFLLRKMGDVKRPQKPKPGNSVISDMFKALRKQISGVGAEIGVLIIELPTGADYVRYLELLRGRWEQSPWVTDVILIRNLQAGKSTSARFTYSNIDWKGFLEKAKGQLQ